MGKKLSDHYSFGWQSFHTWNSNPDWVLFTKTFPTVHYKISSLYAFFFLLLFTFSHACSNLYLYLNLKKKVKTMIFVGLIEKEEGEDNEEGSVVTANVAEKELKHEIEDLKAINLFLFHFSVTFLFHFPSNNRVSLVLIIEERGFFTFGNLSNPCDRSVGACC